MKGVLILFAASPLHQELLSPNSHSLLRMQRFFLPFDEKVKEEDLGLTCVFTCLLCSLLAHSK